MLLAALDVDDEFAVGLILDAGLGKVLAPYRVVSKTERAVVGSPITWGGGERTFSPWRHVWPSPSVCDRLRQLDEAAAEPLADGEER